MIAQLRKLDVACPPLLSDKNIIERVWRGSVKPGKTLPQYEDVVLGSLGRLGDHLLLFEGGSPADFKVLRAGRKVRDWLGADLRDQQLADLPRDCAIALCEVLTQSIEASAPVRYRMHRVADGMVETYEMLAFPMACRWGPPLAGVYVGRGRQSLQFGRHDLPLDRRGHRRAGGDPQCGRRGDRFSDRRLQSRRHRTARRRRTGSAAVPAVGAAARTGGRISFAIALLPASARGSSISSNSPSRARRERSERSRRICTSASPRSAIFYR